MYHHAIARTAKVGGNLFRPGEGRIACDCPTCGKMVVSVFRAEFI